MSEEFFEHYEVSPETFKKMQNKMLEMLLYFKDFCAEHNLMFYLCGGGAVSYTHLDGLLEGAARVFGAHVSSRLESGKIALTAGPQNASCDYFKIKITGKGAHVSTPHLGIDAAYIASQIVVNLQSIAARSTNPLDTVVVLSLIHI